MATLEEIRDECRAIARDSALIDADRLWPNAEMNAYINRTHRHIARETRCIRDATTPAVVMISMTPTDYTTYVAGTLDYIWANDAGGWLYQLDVCPYLYDLHASILQIDEIKLMSEPRYLHKVSVTKWQLNPWWEQVVGIPTEYATDLQVDKIALNYRNDAADTMQLAVRRLPLVDLSADTDVPEIRSHYHDFFKNGVLEQMYRKQDADTIDLEKADAYGIRFSDDVEEIKQQEIILDYKLSPNGSLEAFR